MTSSDRPAPSVSGAEGTNHYVGRADELALLADRLQMAQAGHPQTVLVHGPPGMGKTSLIRQFLASRPGLRTAWLSGDEGESLLALGLMDQLWAALGQAQPAVEPAGEPDDGMGRVDHLKVGSQVLQLVSDDADEALVIVVDDVQWVDRASVLALVFALRRLMAERLLVVFVSRDDALATLPEGLVRLFGRKGATQIQLGGLNTAELSELATLAPVGSRTLPVPSIRRLVDLTGGNPLFCLALLHELSYEDLVAPGDQVLPAPKMYAARLLDGLARCGPESIALAQATAVIGRRAYPTTVSALSGVDSLSGPLDELANAGIVRLTQLGDEIAFSHPLAQAAVYQNIPPGRRRALHLAAAKECGTYAVALRHRVAAAIGADPELALELSSYASDEADRGALASAAQAYLAASRLYTAIPAQQDAVMRGAECLLLSGDGVGAASLMPGVFESPPSAKRGQVLGLMTLMTGDRAESQRLGEQAWSQCQTPADDPVAARIASQMSMVASSNGHAASAIDWARRSMEVQTSGAERGFTIGVLATAHGQLGLFDEGLAAIGDLPAERYAFDAESLGRLLGRGVLHLFGGNSAAAMTDLGLAEELSRGGVGSFPVRILALLYLADAEYRLGHWDRAVVHAELATSLGDDSHAVFALGLAHAVATFVAAGRGAWDRAAEHVEAAEQAASTYGDAATRVWATLARARLAQARGDDSAVIEAVAPILDLADVDGVDQPGLAPWKGLYAEALVRTGRVEDGLAMAHDLFDSAQRFGIGAAMARANAVLGIAQASRRNWTRARSNFAVALDLLDEAGAGLDRALVHFEYGVMLGQEGDGAEAGLHLERARMILTDLAAEPFLARCEAKLSTRGSRPRPARTNFRTRLTTQELAVTALVATGATNRDVGAELVISVKTVEYHLGNIFNKLNVTSRTMLASRFHQGELSDVSGVGSPG